MWLSKAGYPPTLVPDTMPETIARCLGDGWVECADPRESVVVPEPESERRAAGDPADVAIHHTPATAPTPAPAVPAPLSPKPTPKPVSKPKRAIRR